MKDNAVKIIIGFFMGLTNFAPGSGIANVALATNTYKGVADTLANIRESTGRCLKYLWPFLMGIVVALAFGLTVGKPIFQYCPSALRLFFLGITVGMLPSLFKTTPKNNVKYWIIYPVVLGLGFALIYGFYEPAAHVATIGNHFDAKSFFLIFGSAAFGAAAIFIPGLGSSGFVYMFHADGLYAMMIDNPQDNITFMIPILCGCALGFIGMAWVIAFLLHEKPILVYAFIYSSIIGSFLVQIGHFDGVTDVTAGLIFALIGAILGFVASKENRSPDFGFVSEKKLYFYDYREVDENDVVSVKLDSDQNNSIILDRDTMIEASKMIEADMTPEPIEEKMHLKTREEKKAEKAEKYGKHNKRR